MNMFYTEMFTGPKLTATHSLYGRGGKQEILG